MSSQNYLRIGDDAPDFECESQLGAFKFHEYIEGSWAILFSHPADFTPVCTTEIGTVARLSEEWSKRNVKVCVVSVDSAEQHKSWVEEINKTQNVSVEFPILGDESKAIALQYGMLNQEHMDLKGLPLTVRAVYIIDPSKKIKLILIYPAASGRNFDEIIRCVDSLQLTATHKCATPADWNKGKSVIALPNLTDDEVKASLGEFKVVSESCKIRSLPDPSAEKVEDADGVYEGGCYCGEVRFSYTYGKDTKPIFSVICHCRVCRNTAGNSAPHLLGLPKPTFTITKGTPTSWVNESGKFGRSFCAKCGTGISQGPVGAPFVATFPSTYDCAKEKFPKMPAFMKPANHINCENAVILDLFDNSIPKFDVFPGK